MNQKLFILPSLFLLLIACNDEIKKPDINPPALHPIPTIEYQMIKSYPHDTNAFTEGLVMHGGKLFESTGATDGLPQTKSLFGIVNLSTGKIDVKAELDREKYFGEGIVFLHDKVFQLTWKNKVGFVYNSANFKKINEFNIPTNEGWGLTTDGIYLIMSDGTHKLTYLDPNTLQVVKTISVTENDFVKENLNELEYINGYIYANIWMTNTIAKINPADGKVVGILDLSSLASDAKNIYHGSMEMNGIAFDSLANKVYITGKMWPKIYELNILQ